MKKITFLKTFLMLVTFTAIMGSCKKESTTTPHENFFEVQGETAIILNKAYLMDHGVHGVSGDADIRHLHADFLTNDLNYDPITEDFTGAGSRVSIAFFVNQDGQIPTGTYTFDLDEGNEAFTFNNGFIWENHNVATGAGDVHTFTGGTIIVKNDENYNYDITWDIPLTTGKFFTGTYKGHMEYKDVEP